MSIKEKAIAFFADETIRNQAKADLAEIISIPSVATEADGIYPYGRMCALALDKAAELAEKYGLRVENHDYHCLSILYGDSEREAGIVCHLDVVPAGEGWTVSPYELTLRDGLLMGRGTIDDKGPFIQSLYTLRFFKENNIKLPFAVRLILGSDEEVGSTDLEYFVKVRKAPEFSFTPDSEFPVCIGEKGILSVEVEFDNIPDAIVDIKGGTVTNAVPGDAYAIVRTDKALEGTEFITVSKSDDISIISAKGRACHAAMPETGINAIFKLSEYLIQNEIVEKDSVMGIIKSATGEYLGESLGINASNADFGYLTCVGGVIEKRKDKIVQYFNIRYMPETPYDEIVDTIKKAVAPYGGSVKVTSQSDGYFVSADDEKIKALTNACESVLGIECKPYTMGGGTYARWLPNTVAFGSSILSERNYLGSEKGDPHQRDEYISEKEFFSGMVIYSTALGNLSEIF